MWKPTLLAVLLTACGDDAATPPDAPSPDAPPPDAPLNDSLSCTPTGGPGPVTVDGPSGDVGMTVVVVVHDQSGAVVSRSNGLGSNATTVVDVPSCGMVSIYGVEAEVGASILTWANVQPGDHLVHLERIDLVERVIELELAAHPGATSYRVMAMCPGYGIPLTSAVQAGVVRLTAGCRASATSVGVVAVAMTPTGSAIAVAAETPLAASGPTVVQLPAYQTSTQAVAARVNGAGQFSGGYGAYGLFALPAAGMALVVGERSGTIDGVGNLGSIPVIAGSGGAVYVSLRTPTTAPVDRFVTLQKPLAAFPAMLDLDLATDFLPSLEASIEGSIGDPARPAITWTASRTPTADLAMHHLRVPITPTRDTTWAFVTPARPGTARLPVMPLDLLPVGAVRLSATVVTDVNTIDSYDQARGQLSTLWQPASATTEVRATAVIVPAP